MDSSENLYNLLFEISNEDRHNILIFLTNSNANLTQISNTLNLKLSETRRHLSRLTQIGLIMRQPEGTYILTNFGNQILAQIDNIRFFTNNKDYFEYHSLRKIPQEFQWRLSSLSESEYITDVLEFIRNIDKIIRNAKVEILMLVEQFPLNFLSVILDAIDRGVNFKILESSHRAIYSNLNELAHENQGLIKMHITSQVKQRIIDSVDTFMLISENEGVLAFPLIKGEIDFKGFKIGSEKAVIWCKDFFDYYWVNASTTSTPMIDSTEIIHSPSVSGEKNERIVVIGRERPEYDFQAIQDAVDNYSEVILSGRFNIGASNIVIKRSVIIRGDGRKNDVPETKLYKSGWSFPFFDPEVPCQIRGNNIDVTIENIHIENFNGTCIGTVSGNSFRCRKNRITLHSPFGRGLTFGKLGDHVVGIVVGETFKEGGFPGGIVVENNYLDFALSYESGGFITPDGRERDPSYRPDLLNHEAPVCVGIKVSSNKGKVIVRNNIVRNMNSRGILVCDNRDSSEIIIHDNVITSDVFGAYPYNSAMAGVGLFIQSAWSEPVKGSRVEVYENQIICDKVNYCGIAVHGPSMYQDGVGKLDECIIRNNSIDLKNGYIGIQLRKIDNVLVENNVIKGKVYYGYHVCGSKNRGNIILDSSDNIFINNDMSELEIKETDEYSDANNNGYVFTGEEGRTKTAYAWLNPLTRRNKLHIQYKNVIDEGKNNQIVLT
jgi:predicted transcriptional regulator